jgi:hypothetical protein
MDRVFWLRLFLTIGVLVFPVVAGAQTVPAPSPSPSPSPAPSGPADPCTTTLAIINRPTQTTTACTVRPNHILIESGYQNTTADGSKNMIAYPQSIVRVGTQIPQLELDFTPPNIIRTGGMAVSSDIAFGAKYEIGYSARWLYGVNVAITQPSGLNGGSSNGAGYIGNVNVAYTLNSVFSLSSTLGYNRLPSVTTSFTSFIPTLALTAAPSQLANTQLIGEVAEFTNANGPETPTRTQFLAGVQYSFANKLQTDIEFGRSPTESTGKYRYLGVGLSYYF